MNYFGNIIKFIILEKYHWEHIESVHARELFTLTRKIESGEEMTNAAHAPEMNHLTLGIILKDKEWTTNE